MIKRRTENAECPVKGLTERGRKLVEKYRQELEKERAEREKLNSGNDAVANI